MTIFVGDDWAETHHDVHLMNDAGTKLAAKRLPEGLDGIAGFHAMLADHADDPSEVIIGIETDRGMWVQALIAAGYTVYAINPLSVSRYRDRHNTAGAKSDPGDAKLLADLVRTRFSNRLQRREDRGRHLSDLARHRVAPKLQKSTGARTNPSYGTPLAPQGVHRRCHSQRSESQDGDLLPVRLCLSSSIPPRSTRFETSQSSAQCSFFSA